MKYPDPEICRAYRPTDAHYNSKNKYRYVNLNIYFTNTDYYVNLNIYFMIITTLQFYKFWLQMSSQFNFHAFELFSLSSCYCVSYTAKLNE